MLEFECSGIVWNSPLLYSINKVELHSFEVMIHLFNMEFIKLDKDAITTTNLKKGFYVFLPIEAWNAFQTLIMVFQEVLLNEYQNFHQMHLLYSVWSSD